MRLKWCNTKSMLADGLTKALSPPLALLALMAGKLYQVPEGRTKGLLRTALLVAQLRCGGGTFVAPLSLGTNESADTCDLEAESDGSWALGIFVMLLIGLAFFMGCLCNIMASYCCTRQSVPQQGHPVLNPIRVNFNFGKKVIRE